MQQERKVYAAPTLTAHGGVVERTRGSRGSLTELINFIKDPPHAGGRSSIPARKKPYVAPTLTAHGDAVEQTQGRIGKVAEFINYWFPPL